MKTLERNKTEFYYALYEGKTARSDEYGNVTGEYDLIYGNPKKFSANISPATGSTYTQQFGGNESYDKVIVMDNNSPAIDEYSVLWIDTKPELNSDGSTNTPHDYIVKKVAKSLNSVSIATSKVAVSGNNV